MRGQMAGLNGKVRKGLTDAWHEAMYRAWSAQKRAAWAGETKAGHALGWNATSIFGKLKAEKVGAGEGSARIVYPEYFTADALLFRRSIEGLDEDPTIVLHLHGICPTSVSVKSREAGFSPATYWHLLQVGLAYSRGRIPLLDGQAIGRAQARLEQGLGYKAGAGPEGEARPGPYGSLRTPPAPQD